MAQKVIMVGNHAIGENSPVFMIAEIGINHNGSLDIAKRLIDAAFACKWHCVKFQKRTPDICVPERQKAVMRDTPWGRMTYLEYRHKVEFGDAEYSYIDRYCKEKPLAWTASIWDLPSLDFMLKYDIGFIKIPSAKVTDKELIRQACRAGKPVILSTGMSTIEEVDEAVAVLEKHSKGNYAIMHTNSTYPTPVDELNLSVIPFLRKRYGCLVGYSGHEYDLEPTIIAVVLGAKIVERHITLDHGMWGSDHTASLEVHAMNILCRRIRDIDVSMGDGVKKITAKELEIRKKLK